MNYTLTVNLTEGEAQALAAFISRDFGILKNLMQYPETVALYKLGAALQKVGQTL